MIRSLTILLNVFALAAQIRADGKAKPNMVLILVDDMGYGDCGFNGGKDLPPPAMDSIAQDGVRFTAGYVTAPQCAPSRSGLLSGRYQNRFGCEENFELDHHGIPRGIRLFGDCLRPAGYRTGLVGKWHLGTMAGCHPLERGFDSLSGFLGGSSHYLPRAKTKTSANIFEGREPQPVSEYLTGVFGAHAIRFIEASRGRPFFRYLALNAPHGPMQAPESYVARFANVPDPKRRVYAAMVAALDDPIGRVLARIRKLDLEEHNVVVFLSDNGGPTAVTAANNAPLRGVKGDTLEGGIRVPFAMQWKGAIPAGQTLDTPMSSLDLLPTALAAAKTELPADAALDGRNLLPLLISTMKPEPRTLTWRCPFPSARPDLYVWAVRQGDLKLVKEVNWDRLKEPPGKNTSAAKTSIGLYSRSEDLAEGNDRSARQPEKRREIRVAYDAWSATHPTPFTTGKLPARQ